MSTPQGPIASITVCNAATNCWPACTTKQRDAIAGIQVTYANGVTAQAGYVADGDPSCPKYEAPKYQHFVGMKLSFGDAVVDWALA